MASIPTTLIRVMMLALEGLLAPLRQSEVEAPSVGGSKVARLQFGRSLQKHWVAPPPSFKHFSPLANTSPSVGIIPSKHPMRRRVPSEDHETSQISLFRQVMELIDWEQGAIFML